MHSSTVCLLRYAAQNLYAMLASAVRRLTYTATKLSPPLSAQAPKLTPALYPFSTTTTPIATLPTPPRNTTSLLRTLNLHLTALHPTAKQYTELFSRNHENRLFPGSVLTVSSYLSVPTPANPNPSTTAFSGVLIASRRRHAGRDTSFRLRNLIGRTGVEVAYKLFSPLIAEIKVVARAKTSGARILDASGSEVGRKAPELRAQRRAKLYWMRDQPGRMVAVSGIIKQAKEKALLAEKRRKS